MQQHKRKQTRTEKFSLLFSHICKSTLKKKSRLAISLTINFNPLCHCVSAVQRCISPPASPAPPRSPPPLRQSECTRSLLRNAALAQDSRVCVKKCISVRSDVLEVRCLFTLFYVGVGRYIQIALRPTAGLRT